MTRLLALSGRSQAGKTCIANWVSGLFMQNAGLIDYHYVDAEGDLIVPVEIDKKIEDKVLRFNRETLWMKENVYPYIKQYSIADKLKQFCMEVFGATWEQMNGTNDQKNEESHLQWINIPKEVRTKKSGFLTWREVMQVYGTDIIRKLDSGAWIRSCVNQVAIEQPNVAIITDCRFPDEVLGVQQAGGHVVRLTRNPINSDHSSETALDPENFDQSKFDLVLDNSQMTIGEQNKAIVEYLNVLGFIDFEVVETDEEKPKTEVTKELPKTRKNTAKIKE